LNDAIISVTNGSVLFGCIGLYFALLYCQAISAENIFLQAVDDYEKDYQ